MYCKIHSKAVETNSNKSDIFYFVKYYKSLAISVLILSVPNFFMGVTFKKILGRAVNYGKINVDS